MGPRVCSHCHRQYQAADVRFCPVDGAPLGDARDAGLDPHRGSLLADRYRLEQLIGLGAMGRVYRALDEATNTKVAVKLLHADLRDDHDALSRFQRESQVVARLSNPHVVRLLGTDPLDRSDSATRDVFQVMELLDGISLRSALSAGGGRLERARAVDLLLQTCEAVGAAHRHGIVHRDLKPENIMLTRCAAGEHVKVLDFGLARVTSPEASFATRPGAVLGTARYLSPEGALGNSVGPAADVYALATVLFECLTGVLPFQADQLVALLIKITHEAPPDVRRVPAAADTPPELAELVARNLQKSPEHRHRDALELGAALSQVVRQLGIGVNIEPHRTCSAAQAPSP